jgi:hypothetical protein
MGSDDSDREIARLFQEQRRADEASAPALNGLLARPRGRRLRPRRRIVAIALATTVVAAIASVLLLRPAKPRVAPTSELQLASWKAPTDALLRTPGSELWTRVPILVSRAAPLDPAHPVQTTKGVGE